MASGLPSSADFVGRARGPVNGVLENARQGSVVLRRGDEESVSGGNAFLGRLYRRGNARRLHVAVVKRNVGEIKNLQRHPPRKTTPARRAGQPGCTSLSQTAGKAKNVDRLFHCHIHPTMRTILPLLCGFPANISWAIRASGRDSTSPTVGMRRPDSICPAISLRQWLVTET